MNNYSTNLKIIIACQTRNAFKAAGNKIRFGLLLQLSQLPVETKLELYLIYVPATVTNFIMEARIEERLIKVNKVRSSFFSVFWSECIVEN